MRCPSCQTEGKTSRVDVTSSMRTLMNTREWFDEQGHRHFDDPNVTITGYICSNGHTWTERRPNTESEGAREEV
jgi:hypothetical protein